MRLVLQSLLTCLTPEAFEYCDTHKHAPHKLKTNRRSGVYAATVALRGLGGKTLTYMTGTVSPKTRTSNHSLLLLFQRCLNTVAWQRHGSTVRWEMLGFEKCQFFMQSWLPSLSELKFMYVCVTTAYAILQFLPLKLGVQLSRPQQGRREYTWHAKPLSVIMGY